MLSDSVSDPILKNFPVGLSTLRTNPEFSGSFPFLPKLSKYLYYIIINYSDSIRELKFSKHVFSENLLMKFSETLRKDPGPSDFIRKILKHHRINIFSLYMSSHSPKLGHIESRVLPETRKIYRIDPIYSDFTRILPDTHN